MEAMNKEEHEPLQDMARLCKVQSGRMGGVRYDYV